ncbi:MAG: glycoside hydrolase family 3 C-terminal domain-containing protein [Anaerolineaceae bacterium]|nr:glycoside hydrolase family 3 C-terminal domain-containing protein [Anaerolineaceae bacterium]
MLDKLQKKKLSNIMNGESKHKSDSIAMHKKTVEDADFMGQEDSGQAIGDRVETLISAMILEEKVRMLGGYKVLGIHGIPRLGLPSIWCSDATSGLRCFPGGTAFPAGVAMAAAWNSDLIEQVGAAIGEEFRAKGVSILLGPGINIYRVPTCGRNFEYMGEDPHLAGKTASAYIRGAQASGVITTIKHFACNNSDYDRHKTDSVVDERTLREIYLPAFKMAVQEGGSKGLMTSYNPVNGIYASENHRLITEVLRGEWAFDGFVLSDWDSLYSTTEPIKSGLDLEMPNGKWLNMDTIQPLLESGEIEESDLDNMLRRLLGTLFKFGVYDRPQVDTNAKFYCSEHLALAEQAALEGVVLLKNEKNLLPLTPGKVKNIVVMGRTAQDTPTGGGGSSYVLTENNIDILSAIGMHGTDFHLEHVPYRNHRLTAGEKEQITGADAVVLCVGFQHYEESECFDRTWKLSKKQDVLIRKVSALNPSTIVVLSAGGGIETESWIHDVPVVLHSFYLGETAGTAIAKIILGKANPSGKLPFTMAKRWDDFASTVNYVDNPGAFSFVRVTYGQGDPEKRKVWKMHYKEGLNIGYRHFDSAKIEPQFAFGHGLSYTEFEISSASAATAKDAITEITCTLTNTGNLPGAEVVQLYIHDVESSLYRPEKELKGYQKIFLQMGESRQITFTIKEHDLQYFDPEESGWVAERGEFEARIGTSSRNINAIIKFQYP